MSTHAERSTALDRTNWRDRQSLKNVDSCQHASQLMTSSKKTYLDGQNNGRVFELTDKWR